MGIYNIKYYRENKSVIAGNRKNGIYKKWIPSESQKQKYYKNRNKEARKRSVLKYYQISVQKPAFRILQSLRSRLYKAVKSQGSTHKLHTLDILGCSIETLKKHLESLWFIGMSWENYGQWHIDHIKPCSSFDLINPEEQKKCFNYTNLQPLWKKNNLKKWAKYEEDLI